MCFNDKTETKKTHSHDKTERIDLYVSDKTERNTHALHRQVILLSRYVFRLLQDYLAQRRAGKNPTFHRTMFPEADLEAWE